MKSWNVMILPFAAGLAAGFGLTFFFFASRIKFYKEFIERRLNSIARLHLASGPGQESPNPAFEEEFLTRRSESGKAAKLPHDE